MTFSATITAVLDAHAVTDPEERRAWTAALMAQTAARFPPAALLDLVQELLVDGNAPGFPEALELATELLWERRDITPRRKAG